MAGIRTEAEEFLANYSGGERALRRLLDVDADTEGWSFEDVDVDSGTFGEIVSRGLVEESGDGYAVTDRRELRRALGESVPDDPSRGGLGLDAVSVRRPEFDRTALAALGAALALLVALRSLSYSFVFRSGDVVLLGNDPYAYQYEARRLLADYGTFDPFALGSLPAEVLSGDVAFVVAVWAVVSLWPPAADLLLAWSPVLFAALNGVVVYWGVRRLTADRRIALASVLMLAITTVHAYRSSVGFSDHHVFDYLWLGVTMFSLVALTRESAAPASRRIADLFGSRGGLRLAALLAAGVTVQAFAWRGSPILLAPLAGYVLVVAAVDVRAGRSPALRNRYLLAGLALASALSALLYLGWGWAVPFRAFLPAVVLLTALGVFATSELALRLSVDTRVAAAGSALSVGLVGLALYFGTDLFDYMLRRAYSWVSGAVSRNTAGTSSMFGFDLANWAGPLFVFGAVLVLALPVALLFTSRVARGRDRRWIAPVVYVWYLLAWSALFIRFGGSLAVAAAPFAGYGFVSLASKLDVARPPEFDDADRADRNSASPTVPSLSLPSGSNLRLLCLLFLVVSSFSLVQIPIKQSQLAIEDETYETATWIDRDAADREIEYPDNYVLSRWGRNRVYNSFVSGEAADYIYAEDNYVPFIASDDPDGWYDRLSDKAGYVVLEPAGGFVSTTAYARLFRHGGSATEKTDAVTRYRAVYASSGGNRKVFRLVPGAVVTGRADPNGTVELATPVELDHWSFTYERRVQATRTGRFAARVPYPGTYANVTVEDSDVRTGGFVEGERSPRSHWSFDEGRGPAVFDAIGRNHGWTNRTRWTDGGTLAFDGDSYVTVDPPANATEGLTVSTRFRAADGEGFSPIVARAPASGRDLRSDGYALAIEDGAITATIGDGEERQVTGPDVVDGQWHRATMSWNGTHVRLFLDGDLVDTEPFERELPSADPLFFGGPPGWDNRFEGELDEAALSAQALDPRTDALPNATAGR